MSVSANGKVCFENVAFWLQGCSTLMILKQGTSPICQGTSPRVKGPVKSVTFCISVTRSFLLQERVIQNTSLKI